MWSRQASLDPEGSVLAEPVLVAGPGSQDIMPDPVGLDAAVGVRRDPSKHPRS